MPTNPFIAAALLCGGLAALIVLWFLIRRPVLTHATTLAATLALLLLAGEVIRPFAWVMTFGIFTGTFSSIYVAPSVLLWIEHKWPRTSTASAPAPARARQRHA